MIRLYRAESPTNQMSKDEIMKKNQLQKSSKKNESEKTIH